MAGPETRDRLALAGSGARVILVGTGRYDGPAGGGPRLEPIESAERTVLALGDALVECCGLAPANLTTVLDPADPEAMYAAIDAAARAATDILVIGYVGHGVKDVDNRTLFLATRATTDLMSRYPESQALAYSRIVSLLREQCRAPHVMVILDCCFSGKAVAPRASSLLLASAGEDELALAPVGARFTDFSGALIEQLREPGGALTVAGLAWRLDQTRRRDGHPAVIKYGPAVGGLVLRGDPAITDPERPDAPVNPYPGLRAFRADDAWCYVGREQLLARLLSQASNMLYNPGPLLITGGSGVGKSSLLQAGLLGSIRCGGLDIAGAEYWPASVITPGADPEGALRRATADAAPAAGTRPIIVVDQLEELFTHASESARAAFMKTLASLCTGSPPSALVIAGMRAEFAGQVAPWVDELPGLGSQVLVDPIAAADIHRVIETPAALAGAVVDPALTSRLLEDLAGFDTAPVLPYVSHTMRRTWQVAQERGPVTRLTLGDYAATGGVRGAIASTAESIYQALDDAGAETCRTMFGLLVEASADGVITRRRASLGEIGSDAIVDAFQAAVLLTREGDLVWITHDSLLAAWPRLASWVSEDRAGSLVRQQVSAAADVWDREGRDSGGLYRGGRLEQAQEWRRSAPRRHVSELISQFIEASARAMRRSRRLRRTGVGALAALLVVASVAAVIATQQRSQALTQRDRAIFGEVTAEANSQRATNSSLAAQLDLAAYRMDPTPDLYTRLIGDAGVPLSTPLTGNTQGVAGVAVTPDGRVLASAGYDGTIHLWNITDPQHPIALGNPLRLTKDVDAVAFSPDGRLVAAAGGDNDVRLWDVRDPARPRPVGNALTGHMGTVVTLEFSPNGRTLASGSTDGTIRLWNVSDPARAAAIGQPLKRYINTVTWLDYSPNGRVLAGASLDGTVRLWNVANPAHVTELGPMLVTDSTDVYAVAFSPDGDDMVTAGDGNDIQLWDVTNPASPVQLGSSFGHQDDTIFGLSYSPDGNTLALADSDGTIQLFDMANPMLPSLEGPPLTGHHGAVLKAVFTPDGQDLISASQDRTVRVWHLPASTVLGTQDAVYGEAISPNGRLLATAGGDYEVRLWSIVNPADPVPAGFPLLGNIDKVESVAFSPDGRSVFSGGLDGSIRSWALTGSRAGEQTGMVRLAGAESASSAAGGGSLSSTAVWSVALSPNGRTLASADSDNKVRLFDVSNPADIRPAGVAALPSGAIDSGFESVAFSPDGAILAAGDDDDTVRLWKVTDPAHPVALARLTGFADNVLSVAFSPDGKTLAAASRDDSIRLWSMRDPARPRLDGPPLIGQTDTTYSVAFSPDGRMLASASADKTLRLWNVANPARPSVIGQPLTGFTDYVHQVLFSRNGGYLIGASTDGMIRLWDLNVAAAVRLICATSEGNLTRQTWETLLPQVPYRPPCVASSSLPQVPVVPGVRVSTVLYARSNLELTLTTVQAGPAGDVTASVLYTNVGSSSVSLGCGGAPGPSATTLTSGSGAVSRASGTYCSDHPGAVIDLEPGGSFISYARFAGVGGLPGPFVFSWQQGAAVSGRVTGVSTMSLR